MDVSGELEIVIMKSLGQSEEYSQCSLVVSITTDDRVKEGVIVLNPSKTRKLLKVLGLEDI